MSKLPKKELKKIGLERIEKLLEMSKQNIEKNNDLSNRYVKLAWDIKTRYNITLPKKLKLKFCRKCKTNLIPGKNCRVRIKNQRVIVSCLNCNYERRYPIK